MHLVDHPVTIGVEPLVRRLGVAVTIEIHQPRVHRLRRHRTTRRRRTRLRPITGCVGRLDLVVRLRFGRPRAARRRHLGLGYVSRGLGLVSGRPGRFAISLTGHFRSHRWLRRRLSDRRRNRRLLGRLVHRFVTGIAGHLGCRRWHRRRLGGGRRDRFYRWLPSGPIDRHLRCERWGRRRLGGRRRDRLSARRRHRVTSFGRQGSGTGIRKRLGADPHVRIWHCARSGRTSGVLCNSRPGIGSRVGTAPCVGIRQRGRIGFRVDPLREETLDPVDDVSERVCHVEPPGRRSSQTVVHPATGAGRRIRTTTVNDRTRSCASFPGRGPP